MIFAAARTIFQNRAARAAKLTTALALAAGLGGCSAFEDFNPFGAERYKTIIEPDVPPSRIYDEGLAKLSSEDAAGAAKKFTDYSRLPGR